MVPQQKKNHKAPLSFLEAFLQGEGLSSLMAFIDQWLDILLEQIKDYALFSYVKVLIDELLVLLEKLLKKVDPVLAFSLFKR